MKRKITAIILMVVLVLALAVPMAAVGASNGSIVGLWHFDDDALDSSGNGNDGIVNGGAVYVAGMFDQALSFDGIDGYVEVADDDTLDITTAITIEAWINPTTLGGWKYIVSKRSGTVANYGFRLVGQKVEFYYRGTTGWQVWQSTSNVVSTGSWQHLAVSYTFGTAGSMVFYVNSSSVAGSWTSATYPQSTGNEAATANTFPLRIGALYPGLLLGFDGLIDEVRIWDEALLAGDIADSYSLRLVEITKKLTKIEWLGNVVMEDEDGIPGVPIVPIETEVTFTMEITVTNKSLVPLSNVMVKDNLGGDLRLFSTQVNGGTIDVSWEIPSSKKKKDNTLWDDTKTVKVQWSGETKKVHLWWNVAPLAPDGTATLTLVVQTDINPGQTPKDSQVLEYTSEGPHELNSGATLSFCVEIAEADICLVLAGTDPIGVTASETVLLLENKDSGWNIISDDTWGVLFYNLAGPTFDFVFYGTGLKQANTSYSLIYYADPWPGDHPGAWIAAGTSDGSGNIVLSGSIDLGMDLPHLDDDNYPGGAKILLVPSSMYDAGAKKVIGWNPTEYLFEHHLINYTYIP